jgi:nitroreductase
MKHFQDGLHMDPVISRRSVRRYQERQISSENIDTLIQAAMSAPSADDERPWHFIVINDQSLKKMISETNPFSYVVSEAPVAILICGDISKQKIEGFWVQDCAAATENILIEAQLQGLGAVWLGIYPIDGRIECMRRLMNIPDGIIPFSLVVLGYPADVIEPSKHFDTTRIHYNMW